MSSSKRAEAGLRRALEDALAANPDDRASHSAYADLLLESGEHAEAARGEFISVQLALEDEQRPPAERARLQQREHELVKANYGAWLGAMEEFVPWRDAFGMGTTLSGRDVRFRRGWVHLVYLRNLTLALARLLKQAPQLRLLRELTIESASEEAQPLPEGGVPPDEYAYGLWPLIGSPNLANVRKFQLGEDDGDDYEDYRCGLYTGSVVPLVRSMPRLEELRLFAKHYSTGELFALPTLGNLRILQVHHAVQVYRLQALAENPVLGNLTHLLLHPHHIAWWENREADEADGFQSDEGYLPLSVVRPLLHSPHLPKLTHLCLRVSSMGDEGCEEIVRSGILGRLRSLDLRHGRITDRGASILATCPDVRRLEWLDLDRNSLSARGIALIQGLGVPVRVEDQHTVAEGEDEEERGPDEEDEYLTEGEFE
jgi:uncharacterized protein (TIGR02996 family)